MPPETDHKEDAMKSSIAKIDKVHLIGFGMCFLLGIVAGHYAWPNVEALKIESRKQNTTAIGSGVYLDDQLRLDEYEVQSLVGHDTAVMIIDFENSSLKSIKTQNEAIAYENNKVAFVFLNGKSSVDTVMTFRRDGGLETIHIGVDGRIDSIIGEYDPHGNAVKNSHVSKGNGIWVRYQQNTPSDTIQIRDGRPL